MSHLLYGLDNRLPLSHLYITSTVLGKRFTATGNASWKVRQNREWEFVFYNLCIYLSRFSVFGRQIRFAIHY